MIDLLQAKEVFAHYVKHYHPSDERIALKINHTYQVMKHCEGIAKSLQLSQEDIALASLIGLLHDIGRFEQIRIYQTFLDAQSVDHALLGIEILTKDDFLRQFQPDPSVDSLILCAIRNHNRFCIEEGLSQRELLFCHIIRDADKVDIFRVNHTCSTAALFMCEEATMCGSLISDEIVQDIGKHVTILASKRKTPADILLSHAALVFDIHTKYAIQQIITKGYIKQLLHRYCFANPDTIAKLAWCEQELLTYVEKRASTIS